MHVFPVVSCDGRPEQTVLNKEQCADWDSENCIDASECENAVITTEACNVQPGNVPPAVNVYSYDSDCVAVQPTRKILSNKDLLTTVDARDRGNHERPRVHQQKGGPCIDGRRFTAEFLKDAKSVHLNNVVFGGKS